MCDLDVIFRALADRKRRHVLACLQEHHTVSLADLAEFVAGRESGGDATTVSAEVARDVYLSLYHNHVPKLEEADLLRYDQENDLVTRTEDADATLERVRDDLDDLLQEF